MTTSVVFLSVEEILHVHARVIELSGGDAGLRDRGLLESAVSMPRASFDGAWLHDGLPAMAAAYHFHLCSNHPFVDGNKRVAVVAAEYFLAINGWCLEASDAEFEVLTREVAEGRGSKASVMDFFEQHAVPEEV